MKALFDLHTHTVASGHAFSTLKENIEEAARKGLLAMGTSDHGSAMPGSVHSIYFSNYKAVRREIMGVKIFCGLEANIMDYNGTLDIQESILKKMDYVIASLHIPCIKPGTADENTDALIGAMKNPYVKMIGHPDDDRYPLDYDRLVRAAKEEEVVLEVNNSSFRPTSGRQNAAKNVKILLAKCKEYGVRVIMNSDSHIYYDIGGLELSEEAIAQNQFPEELVVNYRMDDLEYVLNLSDIL